MTGVTTPEVRELTTDAEWAEAVPILRQLWTDAGEGLDLWGHVVETEL